MRFYALGFKHEEDVFYNFNEKDDTYDLTEECLLPTEELAREMIEEHTGTEYFVKPVDIDNIDKHGNIAYSFQTRWEEEE